MFHSAVIDTRDRLLAFIPELCEADQVALDTEADSLHAYPPKLCLLQISLRDADVLVDPLASLDLSPLLAELQQRRLILHGADYDLRMLYRAFGFVPAKIFDTMLAARLLGHDQFSLTHLVGHLLGVHLEKGPQTADWARRPLTERMENYARNDTRYLQRLADLLQSGLGEKERIEWHRELCDRLIRDCAQVSEPDPDQVWRLKGASKLDRRGLAVVRELWHWREREAREADKPPYFVLAHEALVDLAAAASKSAPLEGLIPRRFGNFRQKGLLLAIRNALASPTSAWPELNHSHAHRLSQSEKNRLEQLKQRRDRKAAELGIDATLIASRAVLTSLALDWSRHEGELMNWQRALLQP